MKKTIFALCLCTCVLLSGCSGVSREDFDSLNSTNTELEQANESLNANYKSLSDKYDELTSKNEELKKQYEDLQLDYSLLQSRTEDWVTYSDAEKQAKIKKANADKINAEAEENEAEARLKASKEKLSQAEAEEQRRLDEGVFIYEDEYVKISYKSIGHPLYSSDCQVNFWVENKTDGVLTFQAECISLDGLDMGYISMSDPITPQSKGIISARTSSTKSDSPKSISGQLRVIDFDKKIFSGTLLGKQSYDVTFINVVV